MNEELKRIRKIAREKELELRRNVGIIRSKTWGGKPSHKELRRKEKLELRKMVNKQEFKEE
jgi:hypothetical protein